MQQEITWVYLGKGGYNKAYVDSSRTYVLKIQRSDMKKPSDLPERSIRLWNEINDGLNPPAYLAETKYGKGWVCPYIKGKQAKDEEISTTLLDIFTKTGRVITDAPSPRNFLRTKNNQIICVDIGLALQLQQKEEETLSKNRKRRNSDVSLETWKTLQPHFGPYFASAALQNPKTVHTIKALLFIKRERPDIFNVDFLKSNYKLVLKLSRAYDFQHNLHYRKIVPTILAKLEKKALKKQTIPAKPALSQKPQAHAAQLVSDATAALEQKIPINLAHIKQSCIVELNKYIASRGHIDQKSKFIPNLTTSFFRNKKLTTKKVREAKIFIDFIKNEATSYKEIQQIIYNLLNDKKLIKSRFVSGFETCMNKCLVILSVGQQNNLEKSPGPLASP